MPEIPAFAKPLIVARLADRDVHVGAERAFLHVPVAGAEIAHDLAELAHVFRRLLRPADVGAGDDLHQRDAGAVQVHEAEPRVHVVDRLSGVLLQMDALDPDLSRDAGLDIDQHLALADDGVLELADLIALRQVGIEIVLAVEDRAQVDRRLQPQPGAHRLFDAEAVDHRQHARHRRVHEAHVRIGLGPELRRRAGEQLGFGAHLRVHLHPDHKLPVAGGAGDDLWLGFAKAELLHRAPLMIRRFPTMRARALQTIAAGPRQRIRR